MILVQGHNLIKWVALLFNWAECELDDAFTVVVGKSFIIRGTDLYERYSLICVENMSFGTVLSKKVFTCLFETEVFQLFLALLVLWLFQGFF